MGYEKAIGAIKRYPKAITTHAEASKIPGVGSKMADKIVEILESGSLEKVGQVCEGEKAKVINLFNRVWGAGPASAEAWFQQVFSSLCFQVILITKLWLIKQKFSSLYLQVL